VQRHELISALGELRLRGMAAAFDEAVVHGIRQRRTVEEILASCCAPRPPSGRAAPSATGSASPACRR
jgi:hypothetical protein